MSVNIRLSSELSLLEHLNLKEESATPIIMPSLVASKTNNADYNESMKKQHFHIHLGAGPRWWV